MNREMLVEDIKFPLRYDGHVYIWDKDNNMVAMFTKEESVYADTVGSTDQIIDALNSYVDNLNKTLLDTPKVTCKSGCFFNTVGKEFLITRGWGRLKYKSNPELRQDNISEYILNALNTI